MEKFSKDQSYLKISPNKTFSGMIGSYILAVLIIIIYFNYNYILYPENVEPNFNHQIFIEILLLSTVSQIGDIIISYFKRLSKVKDTGKIIPGHGGMLDRIDGMIFAFPVAYFIYVIL